MVLNDLPGIVAEESSFKMTGGAKPKKTKKTTMKPKKKTVVKSKPVTKPKKKTVVKPKSTPKPKKKSSVKSKKTKGGMMELNGYDQTNTEYAPAMAEDEYIKTMVDATPGWYEPGTPNNQKPITVDLNALINDHVFGRTTPDNKFVVASDIVKTPSGIQMIGGAKPQNPKTPKKEN